MDTLAPRAHRRPGRYPILLTSLFILVAVRPLMAGGYLPGAVIEAAGALLIVVFVALMHRRALAVAAGLFALAIGGSVALFTGWHAIAPGARLLLTAGVLTTSIVFLCFVCAMILHEVVVSVPVTWNTICGALCVYVLAGAVCAYLYLLIYLLEPTAFAGAYAAAAPMDSPEALDHHAVAFTYYSFATLATLGMGDITPRSSLARTLSWIEAILGQVYLAVLVARLIGLQPPPGEGTKPGTR